MDVRELTVAPVETRIVDPRNARNPEYQRQLLEIQESGNCPFCPEGQTYVDEADMFVAENEHWLIKHSKVPYANAAVHLVCILRRHKTRLCEMIEQEWASLNPLIKQVLANEGKPDIGGSLFVREGATELTGATVCHLHFNYIIPETSENEIKIVTVRFGGWSGLPEWATPNQTPPA
jgi:diadenosine tetraphosphate (Ap4A) HIT family hydrolase